MKKKDEHYYFLRNRNNEAARRSRQKKKEKFEAYKTVVNHIKALINNHGDDISYAIPEFKHIQDLVYIKYLINSID